MAKPPPKEELDPTVPGRALRRARRVTLEPATLTTQRGAERSGAGAKRRPSSDKTRSGSEEKTAGASVIDARVAAMRELYASGDADAALFVAQAIPSGSPSVPPASEPLSLSATPRVVVARSELAKLEIDHRAGFLLGHIDGVQTIEQILDICAMPAPEALMLLKELAAMGAISLD